MGGGYLTQPFYHMAPRQTMPYSTSDFGLKSGGLLSVVCYPGHPQGAEEAASVERWMNGRVADAWRVAKYAMVGTKAPAPFLMIARKP